MSERRFVLLHSPRGKVASLGLLTFAEAVWRAWWFWRRNPDWYASAKGTGR